MLSGNAMDKGEAVKLLNEIMASCPTLDCTGFYTREIRSSSTGGVELRLLTSLDKDSRRSLNSVIANHGLHLIEEKGLLIIY